MKYNDEIVQRICNYIREGDTQKIAAERAGITESTFYEWQSTKKEFSESIKKAREDFRETITGKLEATLWKRAMGYEVTESEVEYVSDKDGSPKIKSQKKKVKHIQPDTGALIFALTNVAPGKWLNRQRVETQEAKQTEEQHDYGFDGLPEDVLCEIADKLQDCEFEKINREKNGEEEERF